MPASRNLCNEAPVATSGDGQGAGAGRKPSRIGSRPIALPAGVDVQIDGQMVRVKGPKGELRRTMHPDLIIRREGAELRIECPVDDPRHRALHGLGRTLVANMVEGVATGFTKHLELVGKGFRADTTPSGLELRLGSDQPVKYRVPRGITVRVTSPTAVEVSGADKEVVGRVAAEIRALVPSPSHRGRGSKGAHGPGPRRERTMALAASAPAAPKRGADPVREGLETSLLRRVERTMRASLERMTASDLMRAVEAPSPAATIAEIINAAPDVGLTPEGSWTRALARGAARKQEMIQAAGGVLSSGEVAALLGISVSAVNQRKNKHRSILAVPLSGGEWGFPARQFADGEVRKGVAEVMRAAGEAVSPWVLLSILLEPADAGSPTTLLDRLDHEAVRQDALNRVRTYGEHVAA